MNLTGLENLKTINGSTIINENDSLLSISGLSSLITVNFNFIISHNTILTDYCSIQPLLLNGSYWIITIVDNKYNPTIDDIKNGDCSE